jgi:transcriptional regulator with XRE-family HTH domain
VVSSSPLGRFLRARRQAIVPEALVAPDGRAVRRRTAGLRREEVAARATMSPDYYTRLEQGRERSPSERVLTALSRALELDEQAASHLFDLAGHGERPPAPVPAPDVDAAELVDLVHRFDGPALVVDPFGDIVACNVLVSVLHGGVTPGDNLIERTFLDPRSRELYPDWESVAASAAGTLRLAYGRYPEHERFEAIFSLLDSRSDDFRRHWTDFGAVRRTKEEIRIRHHTEVLHLTYVGLIVVGSPGLQLFVYRPAADPEAEKAYERFARAVHGSAAGRRRTALLRED